MTTDNMNAEQAMENFRKLKEQESKASPCPSCGHCPTCGRSNQPIWFYPAPYYVDWTYRPGTFTCSVSGNVFFNG